MRTDEYEQGYSAGHAAHAAELAAANAKLEAPQVSAGKRCEAGHDGYWTTLYGNCMACRAETAERTLAEARAAVIEECAKVSDKYASFGTSKSIRALSPLRTHQEPRMKAEIEKLAKEFAEGYEDATPMQLFLGCRAAIVAGIELALRQEASGPMCAVGSRVYMSGVPIVKLFGAMRAVQLAEFSKEMQTVIGN